MAYTTTDALRSVKRYVADLVGASPPALAAVKYVPPVNDATVGALVTASTRVVQWDYDNAGVLRAFAWTDSAAIDMTGRFRVGRYQGAGWLRAVTLLASAPGWYMDAAGAMHSWGAAADPHSFSKNLVAGLTDVDSATWQALLGQPTRFADLLTFVNGGAQEYRCALVQGLPSIAPGGRVAADALPTPEDWDVRFFHDRHEFEYPIAIVKAVGPTIPTNYGGYVELVQPLVVYLYPTPPDLATTDPGKAQVAAERARELLVQGLTAGVGSGKPRRIPLYDYDGLEYEEGSTVRQSYDFLRVVDCSVDVQPEPGDPRQVVAIADLRVSWRRSTDTTVPGTGVVEEVRLTDAVA